MGERFVVGINEAGLMALRDLPYKYGEVLAEYWNMTNDQPKNAEEMLSILTDAEEQITLALADPTTFVAFLHWKALTWRSFRNTDGSQTVAHFPRFFDVH